MFDSQQVGRVSEYTDFDISSLMQKFKTDPDYTADFDGLILKANRENAVWRKFVSSEGESGRRPYIQITYNDQLSSCPQIHSGSTYYIRNKINGKYLQLSNGDDYTVTSNFKADNSQRFQIVHVSGAEYMIHPMAQPTKVLTCNGTNVFYNTDFGQANQRWYIQYLESTDSIYFINKAYPTKFLEQSGYASGARVNLGKTYDYGKWELSNADTCGGPSNKDVSKHHMEFQKNDGYCKCANCGLRVKSPVLQDKEVLTNEDFLKVASSMCENTYLETIAKKSLDEKETLKAAQKWYNEVDRLRRQNKYDGKYEYHDGQNKCHFQPDYTEEKYEDFFISISSSYVKITKANLLLYNGVAEGVIEIVLGMMVPQQYKAVFMLIMSMSSSPIENATSLLSEMASKVGYPELSLILELIGLGAQADQELEVNDQVVFLNSIIKGIEIRSKYVYDTNGKLKYFVHE